MSGTAACPAARLADAIGPPWGPSWEPLPLLLPLPLPLPLPLSRRAALLLVLPALLAGAPRPSSSLELLGGARRGLRSLAALLD